MSGTLHIEGICLTQGGKPLVEDLSFALSTGKCLALLGRNGAGKSSVIRAITGELGFPQGRIYWRDDAEEKTLDIRDCRRQGFLGYLPQETHMYEHWKLGSLLEGAAKEDSAALEALLAYARSAGIALPLSKSIAQVSGGEKQLACLFYAILSASHILLLDEPTNNLDGVHRKAVIECLQWTLQKKQCAILLASHDLACVRGLADAVLHIQAASPSLPCPLHDFLSQAACTELFPEVEARA